MWGGRFERGLLPQLELFSSSLTFDYELYPYDIQGSVAHARGLAAAGILSTAQLSAIERGLKQVQRELDDATFKFQRSDEDIHTAIERRLIEITPHGAALHAGRSRNDQIALDLRLYVRETARLAMGFLADLIEALALKAEVHADWLMPGYTHLQRAQPVTLGHHLLAHAEPLLRDTVRFAFAYASADVMPLGSGALAGSTLPLDRSVVAKELEMRSVTENTMDAVSDRDFALDLVYACVSTSLHLSRLGEDVVLWASSEFGFVRLRDEIATGSSLMPQKKNPDIAELLRGRAGRSVGSLVALATVLKGLPLTYDRDLQEDKPALFGAVENTLESLEAATLLVQNLDFDRERLATAAADPLLLATDAAEQLVTSGTPFRDAHEQVGRDVRDGKFTPPWDARASVAKRRLGVARRVKALRKEVALLRR
jgi:argininosuccinate lyase